jgi:hypothetical protein
MQSTNKKRLTIYMSVCRERKMCNMMYVRKVHACFAQINNDTLYFLFQDNDGIPP